jgi:hypothetical protein
MLRIKFVTKIILGGEEVDGVYKFQGKKKTIKILKYLPLGRKIDILFHELVHFFLREIFGEKEHLSSLYWDIIYTIFNPFYKDKIGTIKWLIKYYDK